MGTAIKPFQTSSFKKYLEEVCISLKVGSFKELDIFIEKDEYTIKIFEKNRRGFNRNVALIIDEKTPDYFGIIFQATNPSESLYHEHSFIFPFLGLNDTSIRSEILKFITNNKKEFEFTISDIWHQYRARSGKQLKTTTLEEANMNLLDDLVRKIHSSQMSMRF